MLLLALNKNRPWHYARAFLCLKLFCFIKVKKRKRAYPALYIGKKKAFFSFMKAPPRGVMRLFHRKSVINSKNCFLNGFFARNLQNPGLNRQKQQNLRLFTNKCTPQQAPAFFTFMSRVSDIKTATVDRLIISAE